MVHVSELSWLRVAKPADVVKVGDVLEVFVKDVDKEAKKISLGYKKEEDNPWEILKRDYPVGTAAKAKIVSMTAFGAFANLTEFNLPEEVVVAYEPVWAIGTGVTATNEQANDTIAFIRKVLVEKVCSKCGAAIRIQYGGSMNAKNAHDLMAQPEIDGGLIGGASLKAEDFSKVVHYNA